MLFFLAVLALTCLNNFGRSPNVVVILTDDQGWGDLSINGNRNLSTPNIDRLGNEGLTLENFYVCQVCAPTRAEFLTGRYHPKTGVSGVSTGQERLNVDETTIADVLRDLAMQLEHSGSGIMALNLPTTPIIEALTNTTDLPRPLWTLLGSPTGSQRRGCSRKWIRGRRLHRQSSRIHRNQQREPLFCYIPYNTHSPMQIHDRFYDKFENSISRCAWTLKWKTS